MKYEFIIKWKNDDNIHISYGYISEYEMIDGSVYNYKEIHKSYYNSHRYMTTTRNGVLDSYLKRIKEEPENVVRINTHKRNGYIMKNIYHILNNVLHSEKTTAFNKITINDDDVTEKHPYYIDGEKLNKEDWKFYNRKHKLKRITQDEVY